MQELQKQLSTPFTVPNNISCVSDMATRCSCSVGNLKQDHFSTHLNNCSILLLTGTLESVTATDNIRVDSQPCHAALWNAVGSSSSWIESLYQHREHAQSTWVNADTLNQSHNFLTVATSPNHSIALINTSWLFTQ